MITYIVMRKLSCLIIQDFDLLFIYSFLLLVRCVPFWFFHKEHGQCKTPTNEADDPNRVPPPSKDCNVIISISYPKALSNSKERLLIPTPR